MTGPADVGRRIGVVAGGVIAAGAVALAVAELHRGRVSARAVRDLDDGVDPLPERARELASRLDALPDPVRRYFAYALTSGQRRVRRARVTQVGEFTIRPGVWSRFDAVQHFAVRSRGFVWDAAIRLVPSLPWPTVGVRDRYVRGTGGMHGAVAGLVTVVDEHGTPAMAEASLQRYLAEAPWLPTALLPDADLVWTPLDDRSARATLTDHGVVAQVDFHFGPSGAVASISTERFRDVDGRPQRAPWVGHYGDYARVDGMMVPTSADVGWVLAGTSAPYFRARVTRFEYDWFDARVSPPALGVRPTAQLAGSVAWTT